MPGIVLGLITMWLYMANPMDKSDLRQYRHYVALAIAICQLVAFAIPAVRKNRNLWMIVVSCIFLVFIGIYPFL
ncbi:MAG: hypothetical protein LBV38_03965 [Alistipes sp.]|nr:hypothetical protein [Alistipes sp.]